MTYLQLSLYGIPAIVNCGNTLTQEIRFKMETPLFFSQYWKFRKFYEKNSEKEQEEIQKNKDVFIEKKTTENKSIFNETIIKGNCQISLW